MRYSHLLAGAVAAAVLTLTLCVPNVNAETTVTFKSNREGTIKVAVYKTSDVVQGIPLKTWEIDPGKSVNWDKAPSKFHVKVFKPQALDKLLASKNDVPYNSNVTIKSDLSIQVAKKASLVFRNSSSDTLKFAVYKSGDKKMLVPFKTWTIKKSKSVTWLDAPAKFHLKVFKPAIIDKLVTKKMNISDHSTVNATKNGKSYTVTVK